jgi:hypothetical protein
LCQSHCDCGPARVSAFFPPVSISSCCFLAWSPVWRLWKLL